MNFESPLGVGACGAVYAGVHHGTSMDVAIKVMSAALVPDGASSWEEVADAIGHEERAFAQVLETGTSHPHVVDVLGYFEGPGSEARQMGLPLAEAAGPDDMHYFVMERLVGESLQDRILKEGGMTEERAREVARAVCEGLAYLHESGVVHRDICPRNVLYSHHGAADNEVKIIDFSHAGTRPKEAPVDEPCLDGTLGSAGYVAPEVLQGGERYSSKCDVFSLGCTVHAMLANAKLPRRHPRIGLLTCLPPTVSSEAATFVDAALRAEPMDRPTVAELLEDPWLR